MPEINRKARRWQQARNKKAHEGRTVDNSKLYNSAAWRKKRKAGLQNEPLCRVCLAKEPTRYTPATVRDHIKPISQGGEIWDDNNIQSLCKTCHNQKSGREAHSHLNNYGKPGY